MKLLLLRHGETDWNVANKIQGSTDIPLNVLGKEQAKQAANYIDKTEYNIECIYTSGLQRALQTAEIIGEELGLCVLSKDGLEEMSFGEWEGRSWKAIGEENSSVYQRWHKERRYTNTPSGESYDEVVNRVVAALSEIVRNQVEDVLVVTHSAVIMALMAYLRDTPFEEMKKIYKTENCKVIELELEFLKSKGIG